MADDTDGKTISIKPIPNPGSDEAAAQGCTCPVLDNAHGRGCGLRDEHGNPQFYITEGCPLHDRKGESE